MSTDHSEREVQLRQQMQRSKSELQQLRQELESADESSAKLAQLKPRFDALSNACRALQELDSLDAAHLFWNEPGAAHAAQQLADAQRRVEQYKEQFAAAENRRQALVDKIEAQDIDLEDLHYDLQNAIDQEERRKNNWVIEREPDKLAYRASVMPWSRGFEEDRRFRHSLAASIIVAIALGWIVSSITLPILERSQTRALPERVAKVVREHRLPPPPPPQPVEEPVLADEQPPEPEPVPVQELPKEPVEQAAVAQTRQPEPKPQVKSRGLLAFRDSFASRASSRPTAELGASARFSTADDVSTERTERRMVTSSAPGSSGGINLADVSRDFGGGGGGGAAIDGVALSRVASSIGGETGSDRPLSGGASAGRTDEEIQIVFDRYKAALYRLYNRELRRDPTLRGQLVLRLTIEPDGSVSLCQLESTSMNAPTLAQQIVDRVLKFDFGAKQNIVAMTIIYPIDFLPAA